MSHDQIITGSDTQSPLRETLSWCNTQSPLRETLSEEREGLLKLISIYDGVEI